jgi:hypothetical protein
MTTHVDIASLAELVEGTLPANETTRTRAHLGECRSCMAAYADAVRFSAAWLADPQAFVSDEEARVLAAESRHGSSSPRRDSRWRGPGGKIPSIAAAVAIVFVLSVAQFGGGSPSLDFELPSAVRDAAARLSERGLVLPGVAERIDHAHPELRSGQASSSPALDRELREAIQEYERGTPSPSDGARVVAALLASGEIDAARDYAKESLQRFPNHVPLLVFASDAYYRSNDLARAETLLRNALQHAPRDPVVALDLALVLRQAGRKDEARSLFTRVANCRVPALAARANRELAGASRS